MVIELFDDVLGNEWTNSLAGMLSGYDKDDFFVFIVAVRISYGRYNVVGYGIADGFYFYRKPGLIVALCWGRLQFFDEIGQAGIGIGLVYGKKDFIIVILEVVFKR